jgi:hypothetical protein
MAYQCKRCFESFLTQKILLDHLQKQEPCITKNIELISQLKLINNKYLATKKSFKRKEQSTTDLLCGFCSNTLSSSTNLTRHLGKNCKIKKELENQILNLNNQKKQLKIQIKEIKNKKEEILKNKEEDILEKKVNKNTKQDKKSKILDNKINKKIQEKIIEEKSIINNTYNTSNNTNNIFNNINIFKLNSFGTETIDHIKLDEYKSFVKKDIGGFKTFVKRLHYSKEAPENHNVFIPDITRNHARVFIDDEWTYMDKNLVADDMKDNNLKLLEKVLIKLNEELIIDDESLDRFYSTRDRINDDKYSALVMKDLLYMMSTAKLSAHTINTLQNNDNKIIT